MKADERFLLLPKEFWADVRTISQKAGYAKAGRFVVPSANGITAAYRSLGLSSEHLVDGGDLTATGRVVVEYLTYRGEVLTNEVRGNLMDAAQARRLFVETRNRVRPTCPLPMNKQKGTKRDFAFLTGLVNMTIEAASGGMPCDYDPRELTSVTIDGRPLRTLARRVDGAFPSATNPVALWEIKEYYYTTTFGSRVADGVYESLLDGMELEELREHTGIDVKHYLIVDAYQTWWEMGKSYLCRMVDMVHMGYVDEVLFGREVVARLPELVAEWVELLPDAVARQDRAYRERTIARLESAG